MIYTFIEYKLSKGYKRKYWKYFIFTIYYKTNFKYGIERVISLIEEDMRQILIILII